MEGILTVFSEDVAFAHHFIARRPPPPCHPIARSASGIGCVACANKNYLKWQAIQLAVQCTADTVNYLE